LKLRGISGLISVLFLLIAFLIVFFSLYYLAQSSVSYVNSAVERESLQQKGSELSRSISGYFLYNQSNGSASINLTNYFGEPVFLSKILVIYSSGVGELRNPSNATVIQPGKSASIALSGLWGQPESFIALFYTLSGAQASVPLLPLPQQPSQGLPSNQPSNLHLAENNLVLADDFSTDPLSSGRIIVLSGSWSWSNGSLTVQGGTAPPSKEKENIAYLDLASYGFQGALPNETYVLVKVIQSDTQQSYADVIFLNSTSASYSMYTAGAYYQNGQHMYAEVRKYTGSSLDGSNSSTTSIHVENPAIVEAMFSRPSNSVTVSALLLSSSRNFSASYNDASPLNVAYIGLGSYNSQSTTFYFVYVAKNRDPLYVYVEGIPSSYSVEIVGNDGSVYRAIYDQSMGMFKAYIFKDPSSFYPILENAQILVMNGSSLVYSYSGDVCGGCVYSS